jgi:AbiV family abortive infection protein
MAKPDKELLAALTACVVHARDLVEAAKAVRETGRSNIAYHLATLSLEELGKRKLYEIQSAATAVGGPLPWQIKATEDHKKKLLWCFFGSGRLPDIVDQVQFFEMRDTAADIHANRIAGLYVDTDDSGLNIPSQAISPKQAQALIGAAEAFVALAESETPRDDIPQQETDLQIWFLNAMDDPEKQKRIINVASLAKLTQLNDVFEWTRQLKAEIEADDQKMRLVAERELQREPKSSDQIAKDRWKIILRIETTSHSIRTPPLKQWNDGVKWIRLMPQQGAKKKEQLLIEMTLGDNIPAAALWGLGFNLSLQFLIAINMATSGFWWWPMAPNQRRFYESIRDLENGLGVELEDSGFQVFNTSRVALSDDHVRSLLLCFTSLPHPYDQPRAQAYIYYLGGLNFIALNCIQWRCEAQAFVSFLASFKLLLAEAGYQRPAETAIDAIRRFLAEKYPDLDQPEAFIELVNKCEQGGPLPPPVKIADAYLMKLLCEIVFCKMIVPEILRRKKSNEGDSETTAIFSEESK